MIVPRSLQQASTMVTQYDGIWTVPLDPKHTGYTSVNLERSYPSQADFEVVVVDTALLISCFERDSPSLVIEPVNQWSVEKKKAIARFLNPNNAGVPEMPHVAFRLLTRKRWFGLFGTTTESVVSFINGRHRSRYLHFAGATCIPVEIRASSVAALLKYCGCQCCNGGKAV